MTEYSFGRIPSPLDVRDYQLASFISARKLDVSGEMEWDFWNESLDQGQTPHCVGFSMAGWGICTPVKDEFDNDDGHDFYRKCKVVDLDPDGENGSTIRTAAKVLKSVGLVNTYAFAQSIDEITWWLLNKGPVIVGTDWTKGMCYPDSDNVIHPTGEVVGGHAFFIKGKSNELGGLYTCQNSWGPNWGINGEFHISIADFSILFRHGGEALAAVELDKSVLPVSSNVGCLASFLKLFGTSK